MKKVVSLFLAALLVVACAVPAVFAETVETFLDFEGSALPSSIAKRGGSAAIQNVLTPSGTGNAILFYKGAEFYLNDGVGWLSNSAYTDIYWQADVLALAGANYSFLGTRRMGTFVGMVAFNNGNIEVSGTKIGEYEPAKWYNVTAVIHKKAKTIDLWIDNVQAVSGHPVTFANTDASSFIAFNAKGDGHGYMDNLKVSSDITNLPADPSLKITSSKPADGSKGLLASSTKNITVGFNSTLDTATLEGAVAIDNDAVIDSMSFDESTNVLTLAVSNLGCKTYTLTFAGTLADKNGNVFNKITNEGKSVSFSFYDELNFDFEDGKIPSGILNRNTTAPQVVANDSGYALKGLDGKGHFFSDNAFITECKDFRFQADVMVDSEATTFNFLAVRQYGNYYNFASFDKGDIKVNGAKVGSYVPGKWYTVTAFVHKGNKTMDLWVNGIKLASSAQIRYDKQDASSYVAFLATGGAGYLDNIVLNTDVASAPVDNSLKIIGITPPEGATTVLSGTTAEVKVEFNSVLDMATLEGAVTIDNDAVIDSMTFDEATKVLTVELSNLSYKTYALSFAGTVADVSGNVFNALTNEGKTTSFSFSKYFTCDFEDFENRGYYIKTYGGYIGVTPGGVNGEYNAYLRDGAIGFVANSNEIVKKKSAVYVKLNAKAASEANFTCLGTQRYSDHKPMLTMKNGKFVFGGVEVADYNGSQWYEIMVYINNNSRTDVLASLWIDGKSICTDVPVQLASADFDTTYIAFSNDHANNGHIDNISISDKPEAFGTVALSDFEIKNASGDAQYLEAGALTASIRYVNGSNEAIDGTTVIVALYEKTGDTYKLAGVDVASAEEVSANGNKLFKATVNVDDTTNKVAKVFRWDSKNALVPVDASVIFAPQA